MKNKNITKSSKIYSKSLFDVALETGSVDLYKQQLTQIIETVNNSSDLKIVMENSAISTEKKCDIISAIFWQKIDEKLLSFLKILVEKNRFAELESIAQYYRILEQEMLNIKNVEIISAIELNDEARANVVSTLEEKFQKKVIPIWETKEDIIAGLIFKYDDCVIDTSVKTRIENLAKEISR